MNKFQKDRGGANRDTGQYQTSKGKCAHSKTPAYLAPLAIQEPPAMDKDSCSGYERKSMCLDFDEGPSKRADTPIETSEFGRFKINEKTSDP